MNHKCDRTVVKRIAAALPCVALIVGLAGCGGNVKSSTSGAATGTNSSEAVAAQRALAQAAEPATIPDHLGPTLDTSRLRGKTVYYVPLALQVGFFPIVDAGLNEAMSAAGVHLQTCDGKANPSDIAACFENAIGSSAAAMITDYIPYELTPTAYKNLQAHHIPVYLADAAAPDAVTSSATIAFGSPNPGEFAAIEAADNAVISDSNAKAHVLFLKVITSKIIAQAGQHGIDYLAAKCRDCSVTVKTVSLDNLKTLPSLVSSVLLQHPDIDYVMPQTDAYLSAVVSGIQTASRTDKVKIATVAGSLAGVQQLKTNRQLIVDAGLNSPFLAWTDADAIFRMMLGETPPVAYPVAIRAFTPQNVTTLKLTPSAELSGEWYGSTSYKHGFMHLWSVTRS